MWSASQHPPEYGYYPNSETQSHSRETDDAAADDLHPLVESSLKKLARRGEAAVRERMVNDLGISPEQADALRDLGPLPMSEEQAREQAKQARDLLTPEQIERLKQIKEEVWTEELKRDLQDIAGSMKEEEKQALRNKAEALRKQYKNAFEALEPNGLRQ